MSGIYSVIYSAQCGCSCCFFFVLNVCLFVFFLTENLLLPLLLSLSFSLSPSLSLQFHLQHNLSCRHCHDNSHRHYGYDNRCYCYCHCHLYCCCYFKDTPPTGTQVGYQMETLSHAPLPLPRTLPGDLNNNPVSSINRLGAEEEGAEVQGEVATGTRATSEVLAIQSMRVEVHMFGTIER